jgi:hypothetical protein
MKHHREIVGIRRPWRSEYCRRKNDQSNNHNCQSHAQLSGHCHLTRLDRRVHRDRAARILAHDRGAVQAPIVSSKDDRSAHYGLRTARALFADDPTPLVERIVLDDRTLTDASGASWRIQVPTAADPRIAALLQAHREAEMEQAALRGRPLSHPEAQITILSSLPLPGLPPTIICAAACSPQSNTGRERATIEGLLAATQQLLDDGKRVLDAPTIARAAGISVVTVRKHWEALASRLHLRAVKQRATYRMPRGGQRIQLRAVLVRRGRLVPPATHSSAASEHPVPMIPEPMLDQACNTESLTRVICHSLAFRRLRLPERRTRHRRRRHQPPARAPG